MIGGDGPDGERAERRLVVDAEDGVGLTPGALGGDLLAAGGTHERSVPREHERERAGVEVIQMGMARRDDVDKGQERGVDDTSGDALVRRLGVGVPLGHRVGEIRVEQDVLAGHLHEEPALAEPPDVHAGLVFRGLDLGDQVIAREDRLDPVRRWLVEVVDLLAWTERLRDGDRLCGPAAERGEEPTSGRRARWEERF